MKFYAGIGSRETPEDVLDLMHALAVKLREDGWVLRSGGAEGADTAFEAGAGHAKEIFLPWAEFNSRSSQFEWPQAWAYWVARESHPAWNSLSQGAQKLHARNVHQILGWMERDTHSAFVICWTKDGLASGGTGQAIRIAETFGVEVRNLHDPKTREAAEQYLKGAGA